MMLIFCTQIPSQSNHQTKPSRSRANGWSRSGPLDGYFRMNVIVALCVGKCREAPQEITRPLHRESHGPAHRQICLHVLA